MNFQNSQNQENRYKWEHTYQYLPGHIQGVPRGEGFNLEKLSIFLFNTIKGIVGLFIAQILHLFPYLWHQLINGKLVFTGTADLGLKAIFADFNNWNNFNDFNAFFKPWTFFERPKVAEDWESDLEFGRQRLNGMNPVLVRKCLPEDIHPQGKFPVTNEIVNPVQGEEINLETALQANRLYILDYQVFDDILPAELEDQLGRYIQAPICLLYVDDHQQLIPIAIQLQYQNESAKEKVNRIITPKSKDEWLAAKIAVSSADAAYQGIISHLLYTHLIIEPCGVSTYRKLSPQHIVYQLLKPHYFNTFAINNMARSTFLGRGGFFDVTGSLGYTGSNELLNRAYNGYQDKFPRLDFYKLALPYNLQSRDVAKLPNYYYRDDAILIWDAIQKYVSDILQSHYKSDADIINDQELQAWKEELITKGNIKGLLPPEKDNQLNTVDDLISIATIIVFTATAQHAAVNFGQYDYAAWIPNNPFALYQPFQNGKEPIPVIKLLPNRFDSIQQIILVKVLTIAPPYSSKSLLSLINPFSDDLDRQIFDQFQSNLQQIETHLSTRNASLSKPYVYLLPSRIPQSIAI